MAQGHRRDDSGHAGTWLTLSVLAALLIASLLVALYLWRTLGEVTLSMQGWLALGLGVVVTAALGIGLMSLLYFGHRHGYDERAGRDD